ncbi:MAG: SIMPL domain-containing protein [Pseudomonadota bacterium]
MRLLAVLPALLLLTAAPVLADDHLSSIAVTGTGSVSAPPDIATVMTGVETFADTAAAALNQNSALMARVFETLTGAGVAEKDIQTFNLSVSPRYTDRKTRQGYEVAGYQVRNSVHVVVRDLSSLGAVLDSIVTSGANRIDNVSFGFAEPAEMQNEARREAVADARAKAELYAEAAGVGLGDVLSITEGGGSIGPRPELMMNMARAADAVPIATGESSLSASVRIVWELTE